MDGVHDMGGMDGFGKVEPEPNEPPFHAPWEGRVLAMQRAMGYAGAWHIDMSRFAQERLPPQVYLTASYYQRWALAMERNVVERGLRRCRRARGRPRAAPGQADQAQAHAGRGQGRDDARLVLSAGAGARRASSRATGCAPGTSTRRRTRDCRATRAARSAWSSSCHGCHVFPDAVAIDQGDNPQWLYTVVFESRELWGPDADPTLKISIDAFEPYLDPA